MLRTDFVHVETPEPHRGRTREMLKQHPELRGLIGKNPYSFLAIVGVVSLQVLVAFLLSGQSWWWVLGAAYFIGAFADHALFVLIHECAHKLIFKNRAANKIAGMIANIPLIFPSSVSFETYHLKHHSFQGVHELDGDLPNYWEAKLINHYFIGKVIWLLFYPLFQVFRLSRLREIAPFDKWVALNWLIQIVSMTAIAWFLGAQSFVYLVASFFFSVGLHPLGARWIQEHYLTQGEQETYSYYGVLNHVAFNVGFHNEHHDFPSVPWNRLPDIKKTAPGFYDHLSSHTSWTKLFLRFLFDQEISLFSRVVRKNRGKVSLTDESRPDAELSI
ncbi:MAG: fatty acid desaturase [Chitinophagaceae bacterium]|jgi:sphingolipid delta-4 desaturase|nr:fatty acid desaturase [Chitinophagaceae bacterium]MCE2974157.1 fatty acid desaturase [Sediminibacterium sp.]MCA6482737.1 fatty acid desaturase [Chitinophagaceae bacterium]MCA6487668.1 fatty acid desaturase [Chitinophagaceae bacterium]MCA6495965.1 fatty acid desaturase [Chitinophagaceae bacterium]